jgi:predicted amidohydrolase YtcJ
MTDLFLINAQVITMDPGCPRAGGLVIREGLIHRVLKNGGEFPPSTKGTTVDLDGKLVLPGLIDSHLHLRHYADTLTKIDCETPTRKECLRRIEDRVQTTPPGKWVLGHGWNHNIWPEGYGTLADLDRISQEHPIYLTGKSLHVSWANTAALASAGITNETPDPPGGTIGRDESGSLTGILFEDGVKLVERTLPQPDPPEIARSIRKAQEHLWRLGITGVHDFDRIPCLHALQILDEGGELKLRVVKSIPADFLPSALDMGLQTGLGSDHLWYGGVKEFMDGALGPQTAAMLDPYNGSSQRGMLLKTEEEIYQMGCQAAEGGLALAIHAIGDLANRTLLNAYQRLRAFENERGLSPLPHRIEHLQLIDPQDLPRPSQLDIIVSMQPSHGPSDMEMAEKYWGERTRFAYAPKYQLDQGTPLIFGSDAPVEDPNPWSGIHAAVTRQRQNGDPGPDGWHPEGRISVEQALRGFTAAPGEFGGRSTRQGKLSPGFWADLIVLDRDPFSCPPQELAGILPLGTMISGDWVWKDF